MYDIGIDDILEDGLCSARYYDLIMKTYKKKGGVKAFPALGDFFEEGCSKDLKRLLADLTKFSKTLDDDDMQLVVKKIIDATKKAISKGGKEVAVYS